MSPAQDDSILFRMVCGATLAAPFQNLLKCGFEVSHPSGKTQTPGPTQSVPRAPQWGTRGILNLGSWCPALAIEQNRKDGARGFCAGSMLERSGNCRGFHPRQMPVVFLGGMV